jgi:DNA-binding transcriptional ArsR family regulator
MRRQTSKLMLFGILAAGLVYIWVAGNLIKMPVDAEAAQQADSTGRILVVPAQIDRDSYGIVMVDTRLQNLWVYKLDGRATAHNRLRLLAARNWEYDKFLEEFNTAEPTPKQVKELLERLGSRQSRLERQYKELLNEDVLEEEEPGRDK